MSRKIDALVAEHVMGLKLLEMDKEFPMLMHVTGKNEWGHDTVEGVPEYSKKIEAAWKVMEAVKRFGFSIEWQHDSANFYTKHWWVVGEDEDYETCNDSAPMAICLAALKLKGIEVEEEK